jgi:hypothetical protein
MHRVVRIELSPHRTALHRAQEVPSSAVCMEARTRTLAQPATRSTAGRSRLGPNLSVFVGALIVPAAASPARIQLRKGSIAKLSFTQSATTLQYVLELRIVRTLYAVSAEAAASKSRRGKH